MRSLNGPRRRTDIEPRLRLAKQMPPVGCKGSAMQSASPYSKSCSVTGATKLAQIKSAKLFSIFLNCRTPSQSKRAVTETLSSNPGK